MKLVSMILASLVITRPTMTNIVEEMLSSVEAGLARTIEFSAFGVVAAGLSRARLGRRRMLETVDSFRNGGVAALLWSTSRTSEVTVMAVACGHVMGDDTDVTAHAHTLDANRASL